jgi:hydrogenase/urease accessory protein HupE
MRYDPNQHRAIIGGIWLIGFGILFATRAWWPGIMFVIGITALFEGWLRRQPWYGIQVGFWSIFIGLWALARFNMAFLFIGLGISTIVGALVRPNPFSKPEPILDDRLE